MFLFFHHTQKRKREFDVPVTCVNNWGMMEEEDERETEEEEKEEEE